MSDLFETPAEMSKRRGKELTEQYERMKAYRDAIYSAERYEEGYEGEYNG